MQANNTTRHSVVVGEVTPSPPKPEDRWVCGSPRRYLRVGFLGREWGAIVRERGKTRKEGKQAGKRYIMYLNR